MIPKKDINTDVGSLEQVQRTNYVDPKDVIVTILWVDSLRRVAKITSSDGSEAEVTISQSLNCLDLPPTKEGWMGVADLQSSIPLLKYIIPPQGSSRDPLESPHSGQSEVFESFSDTNNTYNSITDTTEKHWRFDRPSDSMPGDSGIKSSDGNIIAALRGLINLFKVSTGVQIIQSAVHKLTRIVTNRFELWTGWGTINISNIEKETKVSIKCSDNHDNIRQEKFDWQLELGACGEDGQFLHISFKHLDGMSSPFTFQISKKGEVYLNTPEMMTEQVALHRMSITGKQDTEKVKELKSIESSSGLFETSKGNGSLSLGGLGHHPNDTLVTYPHLLKYSQVVDALVAILGQPSSLGPPGLVLFPAAAPYLASLITQSATCKEDHTNITVAK